MSQPGASFVQSRAIVAIGAICALVFSLLVSGAPLAHGGKFAASIDAHHAFCHDHAQGKAGDPWAPGDGGHSPKGDCPCCLTASAAPAVLPERPFALARPSRAASRLSYAIAAQEPRLVLFKAANGARAPPVPARPIS